MNITIRHLTGGFIGGFLGIVLMHFVGFWYMCAGCIVGFIGGFWAPEIYIEMRRPWNVTAYLQSADLVSRWSTLIASLQGLRGPGKLLWQKSIGFLGIFFLKMLPRATVATFMACVRAPGSFIRWSRAHTMNRSWIATLIVSLLWISTMMYAANWLYANCSWYQMNNITKQMENQGGIYYVAAGIATFMGVWFVIFFNSEEDILHYYRRYEKWSKGSLRFVVVEYLKMAYAGIGTVLLIGLGLTTLMVGFLGMILGLFVVMVVKSVLEGVFVMTTISARRAHWIGVGVTVSVTIATALLTRNMLNDFTVWLIALGNGVYCGLLSAGAYHLAKLMFRNVGLINWVYNDPTDLFDTIPDVAWRHVFKPMFVLSAKPLVG